MPLLWSRSSPKNLHKVTKDSLSIIAENKHQAYNPSQHLDNGECPTREPGESRQSFFYSNILGLI